MKKTRYLMTLLAVGIILTAGIGKTMAYFTTYTDAKGGFQILIGDDTEIREVLEGWDKQLTIENKEGEAVYVRARAYAPDNLALSYDGEGWMQAPTEGSSISREDEGAWWYYHTPLAAGDTAKVLTVKIGGEKHEIPMDGVIDGDTFNVIVVYESTPVLYDDEGDPYADWTTILEVINESGTSGGTTTTPGVSENDPVNADQIEGKTEITKGGSEQ